MKKTILLFLVSMVMAWPLALAEMNAITTHVTISGEELEAGITPDSPFWGIDKAIERISLALTFDKAAKAKKGLAYARERLIEVKAMITEKKLEAATEAQEVHDEIMENVNEDIAELGDSEQELAEETELEGAINEHRTLVQEIDNIKLKIKGLTAEQQNQLNALVASMESATVKVQISVRRKKDKTVMKIKTSLSDEEINALKSAAGEDTKVKITGKNGNLTEKDKEKPAKDKGKEKGKNK